MTTASRLRSLDVLRGFDMIWIIGFAPVMKSLSTLCGGSYETSGFFRQFCHVPWEGLHFYDTVFPLFVFIAGASFPFSYAKQVALGDSAAKIHGRILRRAFLLVLFGAVYNGLLNLDFVNFRYASVLGKIGIAWGVAALVYAHVGWKGRLASCLALLGGYWALLHVTAPDAAPGFGPLTPEGCFPGYLDRLGFTPGALYLPGKLEPSGLPVSFFAAASALLGMFAGDILRSDRMPREKIVRLLASAAVCGVAGGLVALDCPVIKNLWTPSFTLIVGAYSFALLAFFYWIVDVRGYGRAFDFLAVVGMNAITIYLIKRIVEAGGVSKFFLGGLDARCSADGLIVNVGVVCLCWSVCWFLNRQKIYLKI